MRVLIAFIILWQIYALNFETLIPAPTESFFALVELFRGELLFVSLKDSFFRYFAGLFLGVFLGILAGFLLGFNQKIFKAFDPLINLLRPISPIAWMPIVVILFGIGDKPTIFIIAYAVFFPMLLITVKSLNDVSRDLIETARNFGASRLQILFGVIYPSSFFSILTGTKLVASLAWINLVVGEMAGAQTGLGYLIIDARNQLRIDTILAVIFLIGLIGYIINLAFLWLESLVSKRFGV